MNEMICFNNFKKGYSGYNIVGIPELCLEASVYWLQGENGSGKTTLMKSVAGLIPFEGNIAVCGNDIKKNRVAYTSIVNYAEAEPLYPGFLTGKDLVQFYADVKKASRGQVADLCAQMGIDGYVNNKIATYSSGMAKKLSLVLAFIGMPKLILLDEPLITLDTNSVRVLQGIVHAKYVEGVSFIITSHQEIAIGENTPVKKLKIEHQKLIAL